MAIQCLPWAGLAVDGLLKDHPLRAGLRAIADGAHITDLGGPGAAATAPYRSIRKQKG